MAFKSPLRPKLTENQTKALSKINSIREYAKSANSLSFNKFNRRRSLLSLNLNTDLPPEQQISLFDLSLSILDSLKPGASDLIIQQFLSKIFATVGPDSTVLEGIIIKSLANALDKNGKQLAPQPPNDESESNETTNQVINNEQQEFLSQTESFQQFEWLEYKVILKNQEGDNYLIEIINNSNGKIPFFEILETNASQNPNFISNNSNQSVFEQIKNFYLRKLSPNNSIDSTLNEPFIYESVTYPPSGIKLSEIDGVTGSIEGVVFSTDDNQTIPGAKVEVLNSNPPIQLITDINGEFKIENINFGKKTLKISYDVESFGTKELQVDVIAETTTKVEIPLIFKGVNNSLEDDFFVEYFFELSKPLVQYNFSKEIDENNNLVKLKVETIYTDIEDSDVELINSTQFPNFEIIVDSLEDEDDLDLDEILEQVETPDIDDLKFEADEIAESIKQNGYSLLRSDGSTLIYPSQYSDDLEIIIKNNINLPEYSKQIAIINANFNFVKSLFDEEVSKEREVNGVLYPSQGAKGTFFQIPLPNGGFTEVFTPIEDINTIPQEDAIPEGSTNASSDFTSAPNEAPEPTSFSFFGFKEEDIGLSNEEYLTKYLLPFLTIGKRALAAKVISMIFGPKQKMDNNPELQNILLNSAACGEKMFSVYNNPSVTEAELEFNRIKLKEQLEKGKIELVISCQKIQISLPENYLQEFDLEDSETIGISEQDRVNPANSFLLMQNFVQNEIQNQRSTEDPSSVRRSFLQIIVDKITQYLGIAFVTNPQMSQVMNFINFELSKSGQTPLSARELCSSPCEIVNACKSNNKEEFEKKSAFNDVLSNSLLALVLSLMLPKIIRESKLIIRGYFAEKAKEKIAKLRMRQQKRFEQFNDVNSNLDKATQYKKSFEQSGIPAILNYLKNKL